MHFIPKLSFSLLLMHLAMVFIILLPGDKSVTNQHVFKHINRQHQVYNKTLVVYLHSKLVIFGSLFDRNYYLPSLRMEIHYIYPT